MNTNRLFNVIVAVTLTLMAVLTFQGTIETTRVVWAAGQSDNLSAAPLCDNPAVERSSIRRVYIQQMDSLLTYTDGGPTGVDGGLIELLSNARICSN